MLFEIYITEKRQITKLKKDFQMMNNSIMGKSKESLRKRVNAKSVDSED